MQITGLSIIGARRSAGTGPVFHGMNPATGAALPGDFHSASAAEVDLSVELATAAFPVYSRMTGKARGTFLRSIAHNIESLGERLTQRACEETGLPEARIKGETARTCGQLRMFAAQVEEGSWVDARVDHAIPDRQPLPKPDMRAMLRPIGPVVVFGAANFPLAYSVAGGDTASALAAGCPVIVKAHPSHPGTSELVAEAIRAAVELHDIPEGVFSLVFDAGHDAGRALVRHPGVKGVGFTGSRAGGRALMDLAAARPEPIPVYAEMSSVNPVYLLAGAINERGAQIAAGLHGAVTLGVGQFCTCPGLVIYDRNSQSDGFVSELVKLIGDTAPGTMLSEGICRNYERTRKHLAQNADAKELVSVAPAGKNTGGAAVYQVTGETLLADAGLTEEIFGPSTLLVAADGPGQMQQITEALEGQLTATIHATGAEMAAQSGLLDAMQRRAGRLIFNGFPTGLEVCPSTVHGGPYPATSDGRSTSVGTAATGRWARMVAWQNFPDTALPAELQEANPLGILRTVDGVQTR